MKKVLITGANSYIGTAFENWINENSDTVVVEIQDMIGNAWKEKSFYGYDVIFHVAGIAHADVGKVTGEQKKRYYLVNTDLAVACAKKGKAEGVKQFIFMSSIIVYGESAGIGEKKVITKNTPLSPTNFYGDSKVKAEEGLRRLEDNSFKIVILRPPMIYGKGSKGNYSLLSKLAKDLPFFPNIQNERSMLYIGNLCKFISLMIEHEERGIFFPQNADYVQTCQMVKLIAHAYGRRLHLTKIFNFLLRLMGHTNGKIGGLVNKAFGNIVYDKSLSVYKEKYQIYDLEKSIKLTEA